MAIRMIHTSADHRAALRRLEKIFSAEPGTPEFEELDILSLLVERYEERTFPIGLPAPSPT